MAEQLLNGQETDAPPERAHNRRLLRKDIPGTKANEAWVAEDISTEVGEKVVEQTVSTTVEGTTTPKQVRQERQDHPSFGSVKTTFH